MAAPSASHPFNVTYRFLRAFHLERYTNGWLIAFNALQLEVHIKCAQLATLGTVSIARLRSGCNAEQLNKYEQQIANKLTYLRRPPPPLLYR